MRLGLVAVLLVACGGSDTAIDAACQANAVEHCMKLQTCSPATLGRRWKDLATCEAREKLGCVESLSAPDTAQTVSTIDACQGVASAQACLDWFQIPPPDACLPPAGQRAVGEPCSFNAQCTTAFCGVAPTALCGTCQAPPSAGTSCAETSCGPSMSCVVATMQCQMPVAQNGPCDRTLPCAAGLSCVGASTSPPTMGTCMMAVQLQGGTCDPARQFGPDCDPLQGLSCDTTTHMCIPEPLANDGEPCGAVGTALTRCASGGSCFPLGHLTGTCVAPAADGDPCDTAAGPACFFPARCVTPSPTDTSGTCQLIDHAC
jgi:hypothetical protein